MGVVVMASLMAHGQEPISSHKIYINGTQVTSNADATDILKDGTLSYNIDSRTLTLNNARLVNVGKTAAIEFKDSEHDYAIRLVGNNSITTAGGGISHLCNLSIKGDTLKCTSSNNKSTAIWVRNGKKLTLSDCSLILEGNNGLSGTAFQTEQLEINNANIVAQGYKSETGYGGAAIRQFALVTFNNCEIMKPYWAKFDAQQCGVVMNGELCDRVEIKTAQFQDVWVADKRVSSNNANDLLQDGGSVSYNTETQTLTLNNANIDYHGASDVAVLFNGSASSYILMLKGNNHIKTHCGAITTLANLAIEGAGKLTCESSNNAYTSIWVRNGKTLTIKDCDLVAQGWNGIGGTKDCREKMIVSNAHVVAQGFAPAGAQSGAAIRQLSSLDMNGCSIILPQEAAFDKALHGVALNQKLCMNVEISQQSSVPVSYEDIGNAQVVAIYDLAGRLLTSPQQGLNILKMSDGRVIKVMK